MRSARPATHRHLVGLTALALVTAAATAAEPPVAFVGVTVIDATGGPAESDRTVVVADGTISAVGDATTALPEGARVVEGHGKFLIPGLWDMHVHGTAIPSYALLYVANGVTGVRDMYTPIAQLAPVRDAIARGARIGPRIVAAGRIVDGPRPVWPGSHSVATAEEGRAVVRLVREEGSDFVKVYDLLPRPAFFAIADEARRLGIPFAGHVPVAVTAAEASDAGQRSIEHLTGVACGCAARQPHAGLKRARRAMACFAAWNDDTAAALFATFRRNHTWHCPTLAVLRAFATLDHGKRTADSRLAFLPPWISRYWDPRNDFRLKDQGPADYALARRAFRRSLALTGGMHRAGVELLAGTDTSNPYCFPGFSLHDELAWLVRAGLTPMEALQTATRNPARFLEREHELGTIEPGKLADLVLLDADPLADIRNTRRIDAVVLGGVLLDRAALDHLLADVRGMARAAPDPAAGTDG